MFLKHISDRFQRQTHQCVRRTRALSICWSGQKQKRSIFQKPVVWYTIDSICWVLLFSGHPKHATAVARKWQWKKCGRETRWRGKGIHLKLFCWRRCLLNWLCTSKHIKAQSVLPPSLADDPPQPSSYFVTGCGRASETWRDYVHKNYVVAGRVQEDPVNYASG